MRVPYNSRRNRSVKKSRASATTPPVVSVLMDVVEEPAEDMFDFISIDDDSTRDDSSTSEQYNPPVRCDSTSSLYPIKEQNQSKPSNRDVAVSILEDFFFGSTPPTDQMKQQQQQQQQCSNHRDSVCSSSDFSPTSTILLPPVCSCSQLTGVGSSSSLSIHHQHYYPSTNSLPASPQSGRPKRPSLKQGSSSNSLSLMTNSKRNVSFTDISVREYDVELSDHPSCSYGPPIQLGWAYQEAATTSVEDYEVTRSPHRREVHELVLSYNTRRRRLKQSGYKKKEIKNAQREVDRIKRERLITEFFLPASAIDETLERWFENVKGWFRPQQRSEAVVCQIHSPQLNRQCPSQQQLLQPQ